MASIRSFWPFSSRLLATSMVRVIGENLYSVFIGRIYQARQLGYYTQAQRLSQLPAQSVENVVGRVTFPLFSQVRQDVPRVKTSLRRINRTLAALHVPAMVGLATVAGPLVACLLSNKWLPSIPFLRILCFVGMLRPMTTVHTNALAAMGRSDLCLRVELTKRILSIAILMITCRLGMLSVVGGIAVSAVAAFVLSGWYSHREIGYRWREQFRDLAPVVGAALLLILAVCGASRCPIQSQWRQLAWQITAGVMTYVTIAWLCRHTRAFGDLWTVSTHFRHVITGKGGALVGNCEGHQ